MSDGKEVRRTTIPLTQGFEAIVDEKWFEILSKYKWHAVKSKGRDRHVYAVREAAADEVKNHGRVVRMHRFILSAPIGKIVDHINRNTLDNRESNLRVCNRSQNAINAGKQAGTSSKYKGVCYRHDVLKYEAIFKLEGQNKTIGFFDKEIQAALAYDRFVMHFYGDFAYLNFPDAATCEIVADKNKTIAELRAEVAQAKREAADAMSGCCDCPMFKAQGKTVARQARVIEKLREQRERYAKDMQEVCGTPNLYKRDEQELEAIEQGEEK